MMYDITIYLCKHSIKPVLATTVDTELYSLGQ